MHIPGALEWIFMTCKKYQAFGSSDIHTCCRITPQRSIKGLCSAASLYGITTARPASDYDFTIASDWPSSMASEVSGWPPKKLFSNLQGLQLHCSASWINMLASPFQRLQYLTLHARCSKAPAHLLHHQPARLQKGNQKDALRVSNGSLLAQKLAIACKVKRTEATSTAVLCLLLTPKLDWSLSMEPLCCSCTVQISAASGVHLRPSLRQPLLLPRPGRLAVPRALRDGSPRLGGAWHAQLAGRGPPGQSGRQQKAEQVLRPAVLPLLEKLPPGRLCWHNSISSHTQLQSCWQTGRLSTLCAPRQKYLSRCPWAGTASGDTLSITDRHPNRHWINSTTCKAS